MNKTNLAIGIVWLFHISAIIGMLIGYESWFLPKTPLNLIISFGLLQIVSGVIAKDPNSKNGLKTILDDLYNMPKTMKQLSYVQFFSWFALFAMWIYTTPAVTRHIYGATDTSSALYNEG